MNNTSSTRSKIMHTVSAQNFAKIPGNPIAYWVSDRFIKPFVFGVPLNQIAPTRKGMFTGDNDKWLKLWFEINKLNLFQEYKPYNKGGEFRRWYGNNEYVIRWGKDGCAIQNFKGSGNINTQLYFRHCITWSLVSTYKPSFRAILDTEHVMGDAGPISLVADIDLLYILGVLNSKYIEKVAEIIAPTINFSNGVAGSMPVLINETYRVSVEGLVKNNIEISKIDWDAFETSWDFKKHPLI